LLGLAVLTRSSLLYFLPVLGLWLVGVHRGEWRSAAGRVAIVGLAAGLLIAPWTARNAQLYDAFVLIDTTGPFNLWRGNTPRSYAPEARSQLPTYAWPFDATPIAPLAHVPGRRLVRSTCRRMGPDAAGPHAFGQSVPTLEECGASQGSATR